MKKILSILVFAILCCSLAFADNGNQGNQGQDTIGQQDAVQQMSQVRGLENAMIRVRNEEVAQHLERIMNRIQTHRREMLNNLTNLEITEDEDENVFATGKKEGRLFGFIKIQRRLRYNIDNEGNVERVRAWHEFMWRFDEDID